MAITQTASTIEPDNGFKNVTFTWEEVKGHCTRDSCWVVVDGMVYDLTAWLDRHPGGSIVILSTAGSDATDVFNAYHPFAKTIGKLKYFHIGSVRDYTPHDQIAKFRVFSKSIEASEFMTTSHRFYCGLVVWYLGLLCSSIYCVNAYKDNFWIGTVLGGILMAAFFQQVAFFGHDLGHTSVTHTREADLAIGLIFGNLLSGVSLGWWKSTHNTHHVATNSVESDPDIQHLPFFAVTSDFMSSIYSSYHERVLRYDWLARKFVPLQEKLYYIIMALARFNLYIQSYALLLRSPVEIRKRIKTYRYLELLALLLFAVWFIALVSVLPNWTSRFTFVAVSHCLAGILHVQITLSHFSMPVYTKNSLKKDSFLTHQLKTSLDIDCPEWLDWFHGGLQFQTAHHLFPRVPRHNLRRLRRVIAEFCTQNNLEYKMMGFIDANVKMLRHLRTVGEDCRKRALWDIVNMRG